jgi:hypothetical protein
MKLTNTDALYGVIFSFPLVYRSFCTIEAHSQGCISVFKENVISAKEGVGSVENHFT